MTPYVPATAQLVVEIFVRNMVRSRAFYEHLGFKLETDNGSFVELSWEGHYLYLEERPDQPPPARHPQLNFRVMVPNVDHYWTLAQAIGATVYAPIADRNYGLRDFTVLDPDGVGVRFGTRLARGYA